MSPINILTPVVTPLVLVTSYVRVQYFLAAVIFAFTTTGLQARTETPEEVDNILAVLAAENCEIVRDAMGEKKLSMKGANFVVEASCADDKSYRFTIDQNFEVIGKEIIDN